MPADQTGNRVFKKSFWIAFAFYFLIGFEFFYMVSPFAVYFYSVYRPGLFFQATYEPSIQPESRLRFFVQRTLPGFHITYFNSHFCV